MPLYAVFVKEGGEWYFKKAFTSETAAEYFMWTHINLNVELKVVPYQPIKED